MEENKKNKTKVKSGASLIDRSSGYIVAFLIGAGITGGCCWYFMDYSRHDIVDIGKEFAVTKECRDIIEENAGVSENKPVENAINAYVKNIAKDEYTYYYEDDEILSTTVYVNKSGTAKTSGFQVSKADDGNILLTEVAEGMPAYAQGLRAGDEVTAIDGVIVIERGYENIANKMLGKDGTQVTFTVLREGKTSDILFTRASEVISEVEYKSYGDIAYIHILSFGQLQTGQLNSALKKAEGKKKIVFDLRNNGGGDAESGVYMAAQSVGHCRCVITRFDGGEEVLENDFEIKEKKKIVVLVNETTASAAEIFTASLKTEGDAQLVGAKTYGKGVAQREAILSNGGHLHYTAGTFVVDGWDNWDGVGITPDVEIQMDSSMIGTENDVQLKKALALLE